MTPPSRDQILEALRYLPRRGVASAWVLHDEASVLLELSCVRARIDTEGDPTDAQRVNAFVEVLREQVQKLRQPWRILLTIVLGLDPDSRDENVTERRRIAGEKFRGGRDQVRPDTIRTHHEREAMKQLAALLHGEEQRFWRKP